MLIGENEEIKHVLEGEMIVDGNSNHEIPVGMLMELYRYHGYADKQDVIDDGGQPRKIKVKIVVIEEVL